MRQPHHNRRARGRGRRPQNPANRSYESNGPDVKIRGNPSLIAEKYITLSRDARVSGDSVAAENYMQHAEHYQRIVAASQAQQGEQAARSGQQRNRGPERQADGNGEAGAAEDGEKAGKPARAKCSPDANGAAAANGAADEAAGRDGAKGEAVVEPAGQEVADKVAEDTL